jgi:hypothetical protein
MPIPEVMPTPSPGTPDGLLAEVCDALDGELAALDEEGWSAPVTQGWCVRDIVIHLTALNELLVARVCKGETTPITVDDACAASEVARTVDSTLDSAALLDRWRRSVMTLHEIARGDDRVVGWIRVTLPASIGVVDCAFATWLRGNEIRHAIGRASLDPSAQHLRVLSELAVRLIPAALVADGLARPGVLQLSLSGPGGGEWLVPLADATERVDAGGTDEVALSLCAAARDLFLLMGDRLDPRDFAYVARGDDEAAAIAAQVVDAVDGFRRR